MDSVFNLRYLQQGKDQVRVICGRLRLPIGDILLD